ncbi:MAG TPA: SDR family oxidoreductase [Alphaproteobacteria bacterium]|nr:SDR family oxidoreductase [Alphaproteobacteria bacterium]
MDLELTGRVAIVTGGSRGVGKAIALELAREGVDVAICGRSRETLEAAAGDLARETGRRIIPVPADTTDRASVEQMVKETVAALGHLDILVNNAATPGGLVQGPLEEASEDALLEDINTKVVGYFRCAKAVAPHMQRQGWGRIINIGGLSGRQSGNISGLRNAAIVHLTKTLSDQLGPHGITVNLVHPGTTRTERSGPMYAERARREGVTVEEIERRIAQNIAIRRIVDAKEVGYVVAFLASPKAAAITGEVIAAGGGSQRAVFQ